MCIRDRTNTIATTPAPHITLRPVRRGTSDYQESTGVFAERKMAGTGEDAFVPSEDHLTQEQNNPLLADMTHTSVLGHGGVEFGSPTSWHNQHPTKDKTLNADTLMKQAPAGEDGRNSTFMVCNQHHDISHLQPMHVIGVEPLITRIPDLDFDNSVVHHMNLFLCTAEEAKNSKIGRCVEGAAVMWQESMHRPCYRMLYAYDRDSIPYVFPKDVGVRLGPGSPYTRIVQEWHYLLPKRGIHKKFTDRTKFKLSLTTKLRKHNGALIGQMNMGMVLPPGKKAFHYSFLCDKHKIGTMLANDFKKFGQVHVFAVHLHAHNHAKVTWWDQIRDGKKIGELGRFSVYRGYGADQTFVNLDNSSINNNGAGVHASSFSTTDAHPVIKPGDELRNHCLFDTTDSTTPIPYGTNHHEEMCGNLLLYYPHDWQKIKHREDACIVTYPEGTHT
eukprot:TRINITY_DN546_c0_g1_i2.p1 TRINITY_DN546_c0_g1~~TRINITY_DN546_c0_g1_i2.p1  ORF type:complete len:444 (-),score=112.07 TRINITY_DN546_c0_g1_i2:265-1596(-)